MEKTYTIINYITGERIDCPSREIQDWNFLEIMENLHKHKIFPKVSYQGETIIIR